MISVLARSISARMSFSDSSVRIVAAREALRLIGFVFEQNRAKVTKENRFKKEPLAGDIRKNHTAGKISLSSIK